MSAARATAARLRGCFIGAFSAASAVGAHGLGEGGLPHSATVVVLVLACAGVGAVASSPSRTSALPIVALYLCMGQVIGHSVLTLAPWHTHGDAWSPTMALAHLLAAAGGAVLICAAERLFGALAGQIWRLLLAVVAPRGADERPRATPVWPGVTAASRLIVIGGLGTRGPPAVSAAA
jgi:hypothetical protein